MLDRNTVAIDSAFTKQIKLNGREYNLQNLLWTTLCGIPSKQTERKQQKLKDQLFFHKLKCKQNDF